MSRGPVGPSVPGSVPCSGFRCPGFRCSGFRCCRRSVAPGSRRSGRRRSGIRARLRFQPAPVCLAWSVWCSTRCPAVRLPARCCGIWRSGIRASTVRSAGWSPSCRSDFPPAAAGSCRSPSCRGWGIPQTGRCWDGHWFRPGGPLWGQDEYQDCRRDVGQFLLQPWFQGR